MNRYLLLLLLQLVATFAREQPVDPPRFREFRTIQQQKLKQLVEHYDTEHGNAKNPIAMAIVKPIIKLLVKKIVKKLIKYIVKKLAKKLAKNGFKKTARFVKKMPKLLRKLKKQTKRIKRKLKKKNKKEAADAVDNADDDKFMKEAADAYDDDIKQCLNGYDTEIKEAGQKAGEDFVEKEMEFSLWDLIDPGFRLIKQVYVIMGTNAVDDAVKKAIDEKTDYYAEICFEKLVESTPDDKNSDPEE